METRFLLRTLQRISTSTTIRQSSFARHSSSSSSSKPLSQQANPIGGYYASILESSTNNISSQPSTTANDTSAPPITSTNADNPSSASILFSSRLSSPLERRVEIKKNSVLVAGILVPQRPDEPDNCCMSGCVNCVWDRYGEELEEWAAKRKEADVALNSQKVEGLEDNNGPQQLGMVADKAEIPAVGMDDDGGGSESNWGTGLETGFTNDDLFRGVPVGIREFMKQEKKLKERHAREREQVVAERVSKRES